MSIFLGLHLIQQCKNVKLSSYLTGSSEQKMLERSIRATPFPTNALFPWKLVAPRVHRPSKSEKTDTTSPAFMSAGHFKAFHSIPYKKNPNKKDILLCSYILGWQQSPGQRRERLSGRRCHTERRPPPQS